MHSFFIGVRQTSVANILAGGGLVRLSQYRSRECFYVSNHR